MQNRTHTLNELRLKDVGKKSKTLRLDGERTKN